MPSKSEEKEALLTQIRFNKGFGWALHWLSSGLSHHAPCSRGNGNATFTTPGIFALAGDAYGMVSTNEKDIENCYAYKAHARKVEERTALRNQRRRFVPMEYLSREQVYGVSLVVKIFEVWDDILRTSSGVPRISVGAYVLELQKIRREVSHIDWPTSFLNVRDAMILYMDAVIKKFHDFQADRLGWRYTSEIDARRKDIEILLEQAGVMEAY